MALCASAVSTCRGLYVVLAPPEDLPQPARQVPGPLLPYLKWSKLPSVCATACECGYVCRCVVVWVSVIMCASVCYYTGIVCMYGCEFGSVNICAGV